MRPWWKITAGRLRDWFNTQVVHLGTVSAIETHGGHRSDLEALNQNLSLSPSPVSNLTVHLGLYCYLKATVISR